MLQRKENIIIKKTEDFSDRIIRLYQYLIDKKKEKIISKQIIRSGTSIGANAAESKYAQSRMDFISKLSIALKVHDPRCGNETQRTDAFAACRKREVSIFNGNAYLCSRQARKSDA